MVNTVMVCVELSLVVLYSSDLHLFPHQGYGVVAQSGLSKKVEVNELQHLFLQRVRARSSDLGTELVENQRDGGKSCCKETEKTPSPTKAKVVVHCFISASVHTEEGVSDRWLGT